MTGAQLALTRPAVEWRADCLRGPRHDLAMAVLWVPFAVAAHLASADPERLRWLEETWPHAVVFALGSDVGLAREVLQRADEKLSLGPMTLPHELARLVLYEQIYRAATIRSGINYHR